MLRKLLAVVCLAGLLLTGLAQAEERILSYHSDIQVYPDRSMIVTETIRVRAEGNKIKRGIFRDFPTRYPDHYGNDYHVGFQVLSVQRDGKAESYHQEDLSNGVRTYIGRKNYFLPHGEYTYEIRYRTTKQLGFFDDFDELYWNVTGNGWDFPIDKASAVVRLPQYVAAADLRLAAYTGYQGRKGVAYQHAITDEGNAYFETTRPLARHEGLTIAVGWPKGIIQAPTAGELRAQFFQDNKSGLINLGLLLVLFVYYLFTWHKVGRDPASGTIIPLYTPPKGYSPAAMRYINNMGYDDKTFSTAIINLAVKGLLRIEQIAEGYQLTRTYPNYKAERAPGEKVLLGRLFRGHDSIELNKNISSTERNALQMAESAHKMSLNRNYNKLYFKTNSGWIVIGVLLTLLIALSMFITAPNGEARFMTVWTSIWTFGVFGLTFSVFKAWSAVWRTGSGTGAAIFISLFSLPFWAGEVFGLTILVKNFSLLAIGSLLGAVLLNVGFFQWLKAPTLAGRKLLDKIEGFRDYLEMAEKDEMNLRNPPDKVPALFEVYLPYAVALDVEQQWADKFSAVFAKLEKDGQHYSPAWYHGHDFTVASIGSFASSFASSVSSASTPPGSSSGSGGGGSSGGGGGGGGGGGW
ncbi:MAG: DUF2207 domain-containing protein [Gammaproteobacteria bacterium]